MNLTDADPTATQAPQAAHPGETLRDARDLGRVTACGAALMVALEKARHPGETLRDAERRILRGQLERANPRGNTRPTDTRSVCTPD